ncbi:hypothetical protein NQ318_020362, partial [Aromia moschata]
APVKVSIPESPKSTVRPLQYYFYEEEPQHNSVTTEQTPIKPNPYLDIPNDYYVPVKPTTAVPRKKPKFRLVQQPVKTDTFSIHIARLQDQLKQYYTTPKNAYQPAQQVQSPKPIYQFSFQAENYQPQQKRFKPSQPDLNQEDQFRPLPKYSVQIQQAIEIIPTESPAYQQTPVYYQQDYRQTTEKPRNYYSTARPSYGYEGEVTQKARYQQNVGTPRPISEYSFEVTPNPIYQGFYTKPDEGYFDDNTKKYFTVFGKKLPSSTSPIPNVEHTTVNPNYNRQNAQYQQPPHYQKPVSLDTDTIVNYVHPRPPLEETLK